MRWGDLEPLKASAFGRYVARIMTPLTQIIRFAGCFVAWGAAWFHAPLLIGIGVVTILAAWLRGILLPR